MRRNILYHQEAFPLLRGSESADIAIAGGGLSGLTAAVWLSRVGLRVALVEGGSVGSGASAHCMGVTSLSGVRYAAVEKRFGASGAEAFAQTNRSAFRAVRELAEAIGAWEEADVSITGFSDRQALEMERDAMKRQGLEAQMEADGRAIYLAGMGRVSMPDYLQQLVRLAQEQGVSIHERSRVVSMETNELYTEQGSIRAPYLIVATGYPILNVPGWYFLHLAQHECAVKPLTNAAALRGIQTSPNGDCVMTGDFLQCRAGLTGDGSNLRKREQAARALLAGSGMKEAGEWQIGSEVHTTDGLPVIGTYSSKTPNLFVACGYGGRGLIGSMLASQAISSRVLGLPSEGYGLYEGGRLYADLKAPVRTGARYLGAMLAHPRAPRCPHMGCRLVLNPYTRLWECPCHGSRFDDIGHVVSSPAVHEAVLRSRK